MLLFVVLSILCSTNFVLFGFCIVLFLFYFVLFYSGCCMLSYFTVLLFCPGSACFDLFCSV